MSAIDALDLRPMWVLDAEHYLDQLQAQSDKIAADFPWDWPTFPHRTAEFIETGTFPRHSWKTVTISLKATRLLNKVAHVAAAASSFAAMWEGEMDYIRAVMGDKIEGGAIIYKGSRWMRLLHWFGLSPGVSSAHFLKPTTRYKNSW